MRRLVPFFLILCTLLLPAQSFAENILNTAWLHNVGPLNPHDYYPNEMFAQNMVYEGLTHYNGKEAEPCLAASWSISEDQKTYTFSLRKDVKFSDGTPFNAYAAEKNFDAIMQNKERHAWLALVNLIESWKALDEYTFEIKLSSPYNLTLTELSLPRPFRFLGLNGFLPDSEKRGGAHQKIAAPIGTGPWVLKEQKLGQYDYFERNPHYIPKTADTQERGNIDAVKIYVLPEANSRILALETGQTDILFGEGNFNIENFVRLSSLPDFAGEKSEPRITCLIALNSNRSYTKDANVRKAILHAVNKDIILQYILRGQEYRAERLFNPGTAFSDIGTVYACNPQKSEELLTQSGFVKNGVYFEKNGTPIELNLHYLGIDPKQKAIAEAVQADLEKVGIKLNLRAEENTLLTSLHQNGEFDLIFNRTWGPPYEPTSYLASMRRPSHADYQAQLGLADKTAIDAQITELLTTTDRQNYADLHKNVLEALHNGAVYLPISFEPDFVLYNSKKVSGFRFGSISTEILLHTLTLNR